MTRTSLPAAFATLMAVGYSPAISAHAIAGARVFPATLTIDDPAVSDEESFPTFQYMPQGGTPPTNEYDYTFEYDKRITENFGIAINDGMTVLKSTGMKSLSGWQDLSVTFKYEFPVNAEHEFAASVGIIREFGATGAARIGVDSAGTTTPTVYFGKGFGDLPTSLDYIRPFAFTGEIGYQISDEASQSSPGPDPDTGLPSLLVSHNPNQIVIGASLQYSLPYLQTQVKDIGLGSVFGNIIPLVEFSYSTPTSTSFGTESTGIIAPGLIYLSRGFQFGVEALIPSTRFSGHGVGVIAQFHVFLDDLFPKSLGKPFF